MTLGIILKSVRMHVINILDIYLLISSNNYLQQWNKMPVAGICICSTSKYLCAFSKIGRSWFLLLKCIAVRVPVLSSHGKYFVSERIFLFNIEYLMLTWQNFPFMGSASFIQKCFAKVPLMYLTLNGSSYVWFESCHWLCIYFFLFVLFKFQPTLNLLWVKS